MRSFIISPIGQPGTPARDHADDVFECVIEPALRETGVTGHRADHVKDVGRISEQMFDDILGADFCIGVLAGFNPNVFYEIAVAHSAGIPVILLCEKGVVPPFDLKDERVFHYDLSPRAISRGDNPKALAELIENVRKLKGKRIVPFGDNLTPLNGAPVGADLQVKKENIAAASVWTSMIDAVERRFYVSALGLTGWKGILGMKESLVALGQRGCEVRILTMHSANPALPMLLNPDITTGDKDALTKRVDGARDWFKATLRDNPRASVRAIRNGAALQQIIVTDDTLSWSPYLYSANTMHSPRLEFQASSPLFGAILGEFEALWNANPD